MSAFKVDATPVPASLQGKVCVEERGVTADRLAARSRRSTPGAPNEGLGERVRWRAGPARR